MDRINSQIISGNNQGIKLLKDSPMAPSYPIVKQSSTSSRDPFADLFFDRMNQQALSSSNFSGSSKHKLRIPEEAPCLENTDFIFKSSGLITVTKGALDESPIGNYFAGMCQIQQQENMPNYGNTQDLNSQGCWLPKSGAKRLPTGHESQSLSVAQNQALSPVLFVNKQHSVTSAIGQPIISSEPESRLGQKQSIFERLPRQLTNFNDAANLGRFNDDDYLADDHSMTEGKKSKEFKNTLQRVFSEGVAAAECATHKAAYSRKLFSPQMIAPTLSHGVSLKSQGPISNSQLLGGALGIGSQLTGAARGGAKSSEKLMDRFIPYRLGENLQARFEAVSQKFEEEIQYNQLDIRTSQLVQELGLNLDQPLSTINSAPNGNPNDHNLPSDQVNGVQPAQNSNNSQNGGTGTHRSRGFSNIFGGLSTVDQVNGFALSRQSSVTANGNSDDLANNAANPTSQSLVYPTLPNTSERDLQANILNYNNLLEQQIFEQEEPHEDINADHQRNLTLAGVNGFSRSFFGLQSMKENRGETANQGQSKPMSSGALGGKIFKFKKNNPQRDSSSLLQDNLGSSKNPFTTNFLNLDGDHSSLSSSMNPFAPRGRKIAERPYKVLDAPNLSDDFYLNLVDWSQQNMLAVALGQSVYVWNAFDSSVQQLCELDGLDNQVTSVAWSQRGSHLCVGNRYGEIAIWDVNVGKEVRTLAGHSNRVGACSWNGSLIATGSRDRSILVRDVRAQENYHQRLLGHKQEVCGLKWSMHDENQIASGGNDNKLFIWQPMSNGDQPLAKFSQHQAAVKAIGWSPQQRGLLATGGGTADQCIRFWNTLTLQHINSVNTGSQVCNLMFSRTTDEIVSTHGYSLNQIIVWKYPTMEKISTLTGHTFRVLYLAMSPDGASIVTGAGDETLRFWNVFPKCKSSKGVVSNLHGGGGGIGNVIGTGNSTLFPSNIDFR